MSLRKHLESWKGPGMSPLTLEKLIVWTVGPLVLFGLLFGQCWKSEEEIIPHNHLMHTPAEETLPESEPLPELPDKWMGIFPIE
jgi:hypothetical protein